MFTRRSWIGITVLIVLLVVLAALSGSGANPLSSVVSKVGLQNPTDNADPMVKVASSVLQFHNGCVIHFVDVSVPENGTYIPEMIELSGPVNVTLTQEVEGLSPYSLNVVADMPFQVVVDDYRLRVAYKSDTYWFPPQSDDQYEQLVLEPWQLLYRESVRFDVPGQFRVFVWPDFGIEEGVKVQLEVCQ